MVSVSTVLKAVGGLICIGALLKLAVIGFYPSEFPVISLVVFIGVGMVVVGSRVDGWRQGDRS